MSLEEGAPRRVAILQSNVQNSVGDNNFAIERLLMEPE